ncbi:dihydropteroate synthase [Legionella hackeliae]|uniref:Dihydropteroate synthase n=1 Tax=Legionella hackeliae TaxID=449 RepID=A0A0A8UWS2_LEGHA|nr:dihydropteroate synthase [Legionella hackeliae]KTD12575.1 7,8-dihydropteroate synthase [Legionella hackeliae]CEK11991.1 Dihydropteroate synthase [Legionella hackeliae]STX48773.1 dihydropteroate synthase [Legionella hackeliae]
MNSRQFQQWCELYQQPSAYQQKPLIMGILNVTPDSFSDGGKFLQRDLAVKHALNMIASGADLIDIGGESSRPGAESVSCEEELARVIPVIERLREETDSCISIDTTKAQVMEAAVAAGANMINDISALSTEESLNKAAKLNVPICLMHMQGEPMTMQEQPHYDHDILDELHSFFQKKIKRCLAAGIKFENLILDPGFGFGKLPQHNLRLVKHVASFTQYNRPVMLGASRKTTIGVILQKPVEERLLGGLTIAIVAALQGVAILRTHDIDETQQMLTMLGAIFNETAANGSC